MSEETIAKYYDSNNKLMAILIKNEHKSHGIDFLTSDDAFMQVAIMNHPKGHIIQPHYHNLVSRVIDYTCEALIIKNGILDVFLYENMIMIHEFKIKKGDVLVLYSGGHGFKCCGEVSMIEIKQGPFVGKTDKTRFDGGI